MLQITPQMRILVAVEPADFRKGIDGLVRLCKDSLQEDPFGGAVFVFRNRRGTAIKALVYDGQGFWLCHKRLSEGRFRWWPSASGQDVPGQDLRGQDARAKVLAAHQLSVLFSAGDPDRTSAAPDWRPVGPRS
jgi:transposase